MDALIVVLAVAISVPISSQESHFETETVCEWMFMPSGELRYRLVWDVDDNALSQKMLEESLAGQDVTFAEWRQLSPTVELLVVNDPPRRNNGFTRYIWTVYCSDANALVMNKDSKPMFHLSLQGTEHILEINSSFWDEADISGRRYVGTVVMPGKVKSASGGGKPDGRSAIYKVSVSDEVADWSEGGIKRVKADVCPRIIRSDVSKISSEQKEAFRSEYEAARMTAQKRDAKKQGP